MARLFFLASRHSYRRFLCCVLVLLAINAHIYAEEESANSEAGFDFHFRLGLGAASFDDVTYQKIALMPELILGKFGIAFDFSFHFRLVNSELVFRSEDWVPREITFPNVLGLYLAKFRYIRYGVKGDPLYVKFGSISDGTLGNGFIMGGYSNTLFLPERRILGLSFDLDGALFDFPLIGFETHIGDLSAFDVMGARLFVRPFALAEVPIIGQLQIGGTVVADLQPYRYAESEVKEQAEAAGINTSYTEAKAYAFGADAKLPLLSGPLLSLTLFADAATLKARSIGGMVGAGGRLLQIILFGAQLRFLGESFVPSYFDATYDISRAPRYALLEGVYSTPAFTGWLAGLGVSLFEDTLVFMVTVDGPFGTVDPANAENFLNYPHLRAVVALQDGPLPGFWFDLSYDKRMLRHVADLISPEWAVARARVNYRIGPAVISFFYQLRYEENDWESAKVTSGLDGTIQLF